MSNMVQLWTERMHILRGVWIKDFQQSSPEWMHSDTIQNEWYKCKNTLQEISALNLKTNQN
jgi:hypothetical protein